MLESIRGHNAFFESMLQRIPPSVYMPQVVQEVNANQFMHKKKGKVSTKTMRKRMELDPSQTKSVVDLQKLQASADEREEEPSDDSFSSAKGSIVPLAVSGESINVLRERLREKIVAAQPNINASKKRDRSSKKGTTKEKVLKKAKTVAASKPQEKKKAEPAVVSASNVPVEQVEPVKSQGGIEFSNLIVKGDDALLHKKQGLMKARKKKSNKELLRIAENVEKRINRLEGDKKDKALKKEAFKTAMLKAEGKKIKTDKSLLKKSVAREEQKKRKSQKEWKKRVSVQKKEKMANAVKKDERKIKTLRSKKAEE